jgi:SnoaL-like polyketide cyclase
VSTDQATSNKATILIEEGDKVVSRNTVTGTHQGEYMGIPPTGKSVTYNEIFIARFAGGRIAETWGVVDVLSQMRQLGAIPGRVMTAATAVLFGVFDADTNQPPGPDASIRRSG